MACDQLSENQLKLPDAALLICLKRKRILTLKCSVLVLQVAVSRGKLMPSISDTVAENSTIHHNPYSYLQVFWRLGRTGTCVPVARLGMYLD